jgi:uracil-DNA glycosylase family 4
MIVKPDGPTDARVVVLGEAPGQEEANEGKPFVGPSGRLLWDQFFARAGIRRDQCLLTNVHWELPPKKTWDSIPEAELGKFDSTTMNVICEKERDVIIAIGGHALDFLMTGTAKVPRKKRMSITRWRGSLLSSEKYFDSTLTSRLPSPCWAIPMIHPSAVLRTGGYGDATDEGAGRTGLHYRALCIHDAARAYQAINDSSFVPPERTVMHAGNASPDDIIGKLKAMQDDVETPIAFDIETYAQTITCMGLATNADSAIVIPLTEAPNWLQSQKAYALSLVSDILCGPAPKIGQNLDYDVQYLARMGIPVGNVWMDTAVAHSILYPELPHDLGLLSSLYTLQPYFKDMRKDVPTDIYNEQQWEYNGLDCCVTWEVGMKLEHELRNQEPKGTSHTPWSLFHERVMPAQKALIRMEYRGVKVDKEIRTKRQRQMAAELERLKKSHHLNDVNPWSPKQVRDQLHAWKCTKARSTDEKTLKKVRSLRQDVAPFIDTVLACRRVRKLKSTYVEAKEHPDGRMRCAYRLFVTETGRCRSGADVFDLGMNLQNVPTSQRDWIIPDDGLVFWEADADQIEARFTAWLSGDESYATAFLEGKDVHAQHAAALFRIPEDRVHELVPGTTKSYRDIGKRVTHGWGYWMGARTLQTHINDAVPEMAFTERDGHRFLQTLDSLRPGVAAWRLRTVEELRHSRTLWTPYGRPRAFMGLWRGTDGIPNDLHREAVAHRPQSCAADHMHGALIRVEKRLQDIQGDLLLYTHDALAGQCTPDSEDHVKALVCEEISRPAPLVWQGHDLVIPAKFASGTSWKDAHP